MSNPEPNPFTSGQSYDPYKLIEDVVELLSQRGLTPVRIDGMAGQRVAGAGQLLRSLNIAPLMAYEDAVGRDSYQDELG